MDSNNSFNLTNVIQDESLVEYISKDNMLLRYFLSFDSDIKFNINNLFLKDIIYHPYKNENKLCFITKKAEKLYKNNHEFTIFYKSLKNKTNPLQLDNLLLTPFTSIKIPEEYGDYLVDYSWIINDDNTFIVIFTDSYYLIYELPSIFKNITVNKGNIFNILNINFMESNLVFVKTFAKHDKPKKHSVIISHNKTTVDSVLKYISHDDVPWKQEDSLPYNNVSENFPIISQRDKDKNDNNMSVKDQLSSFPLKFLALECLGYQTWWNDIEGTTLIRLTVDAIIDPQIFDKFQICFDNDINFKICDIDLLNDNILSNLKKFINIENDIFIKDLWHFLRLHKKITKTYEYIQKSLTEIFRHEHSIEKFWKSAESHYEPNEDGSDLFSDLIKYMTTGVCDVELKEWFSKHFNSKQIKKYQKHLTDFYFKPIEIQSFYQSIDVFIDNLYEIEVFLKLNKSFTDLLSNSMTISIDNEFARLRQVVYEIFKKDNSKLSMRFSNVCKLLKLDQQQHLKFFDWIVSVSERLEKKQNNNNNKKLEKLNISFKNQMEIVSFMSLFNIKLKTIPRKKNHIFNKEMVRVDEKTGFNSMSYFNLQTKYLVEECINKIHLDVIEKQIYDSLTPIIREVLLTNV
ncbi:hypothetical protein HANVADRAFT_1966 [Hanseniaspora valbyensis NRRL Y-1626]|uniref:Anaphase-promoting complex subunit 4 long domain-containing protein n=1 Tax=Hanseniaspora valbyensis NRRL Y-1626 TaxID=766949 RepID=A0A1B7TEI3_9ASCO|nr:hypothetical protein HANVADRAFT_1966 [Hanseniaspora valbyensis NRRL Y-1626]